MSDISQTILYIAIGNILLIALLGRVLRLVFSLITFWWLLWLFIATLDLTDFYVPEDNTCYLFITMILSTVIGGLAFVLIGPKKIYNHKLLHTKPKSLNLRKIYCANLLAFFIILFFFLKAILLFINNPLLLSSGYRSLVFYEDILFSNSYIGLLYNLLISPIPYALLFIGAAIYAIEGKFYLLAASSLLIIMESIMYGGRFGFYSILIVVLLALLFKSLINRFNFGIYQLFKIAIKKFKIIVSILIVASLMLYMSFARSPAGTTIGDIFDQFVLEYHTLGFVIFDRELNNSPSFLEDKTYGRSSLGTFDVMLTLVLRRIDDSFESPARLNGLHLSTPRVVGQKDGKPLTGIAFGTILFPIYRDGGVIYTFLFPLLYGFSVAKFSYLTRILPNTYSLAILLALLYLAFFGIFTPLISSNYWLFLVFINIMYSHKNKYRLQEKWPKLEGLKI